MATKKKKTKKVLGKALDRKSRKKAAPPSFSVVGVGASAGGLEAFSELLSAIPKKPGFAIVFVQHLAPTHESALVQLLQRKSTLPILEARHSTRLLPDHVYIITPGTTFEVRDSCCIVVKRRVSEGVFHPVDILFRSLAKEYGSRAIGVILSGTATDGTEGLLAIKEAGGITFVQDESAKYAGMPQSAAEAGSADFTLPPKHIAKELLLITKHPFTSGQKSAESAKTSLQIDKDEIALRKILLAIADRFGIDFTHYKQTTVQRRIRRRMALARKRTLDDYARYMKDTEGEDHALYQDLLINVTSFFRDAELMGILTRKVLPRLLKGRDPSDVLRMWVPGCSTGEEVYSLAIMLAEILGKRAAGKDTEQSQLQFKIFGTDANENAIEKARTGIYPRAALSSLSNERLARFFTPHNGSFQVRKTLRETCVFSPHNFLKDPPFSRMDIVSCRNVLIYLEPTLQKKAISAFHYALKPGGSLILGKSETVGADGNLFEIIDNKYKAYAKRRGSVARMFVSEPSNDISAAKKNTDGKKGEREAASIEEEADLVLLSRYTPASMVVNSGMEIIRFRGAISPYLEPASGDASLKLFHMVREELALDLRSLLHAAKKGGRSVYKEGIPMKRKRDGAREGKGGGSVGEVAIEVVPLSHASQTHASACFLILFSEQKRPAVLTGEAAYSPASLKKYGEKSEKKRIDKLTRELDLQRKQTLTLSEGYETANEELQSANEEVLSSNEELQSINEELETSQEELQSTNEELTTINDELQARNSEIAEARDFAEAIITTIHEPLIILNKNLRVRTASKAFYKQFKITPEETEGRSLYDLGNGAWDVPSLRTLMSEVLPKDKSVQNFLIEHEFPKIGRRVLLLNGRTVEGQRNRESLILLVVEDVTGEHDFERSRNEFIGMAGHELRTPITSIKGYAQLLEEKFKEAGDGASAELTGKLDRQIDKLTDLIDDLFDDTKVKEGKLNFHLARFDLNALTLDAIEEIGHTTKQHTITHIFGEMPDMYGDKERLRQVVVNLLTNAVKYSPKAAKIKVTTKAGGQSAVLSVRDFGLGIGKEDQAKIFTRFYRVHEKELDTYPGLGLGLYISKEIVERHGGTMTVKSKKGKGSTFTVTLPIKRERERGKN